MEEDAIVGVEAAAASPIAGGAHDEAAQPATTTKQKMTILDLPVEVQKGIFKHVSTVSVSATGGWLSQSNSHEGRPFRIAG